ncbi:hypothetical protein HGRIS_009258 [Hohenbuehelia grisea]|uniref:Cytochrome P450 n=1 Tax=Hohenbuehelia grisea TaxID=104357 RepID=A0ABR3J209_9AGAR
MSLITYYTQFSAILILLVVFALLAKVLRRRSSPRLPPGPKGLPLIGNVLDMPSTHEWLTFAKWGETWGDICSVTVFGQSLIILNSAKAATDMLDGKSLNYSERPILQMGGELVGWKDTLVLLPYGERFRSYRRNFHRLIGTRTHVARFHRDHELETRRFLRRVLVTPDDFAMHIRRMVGAVSLRVSHGYEVKEFNDPIVELVDRATDQFSLATAPGGFLVDLFPFLSHLPGWLPGMGFKRTAREWSATLTDMVDVPFEYVKRQMAAGIAPPSFTSVLLENKELTPNDIWDIKWSAASLYSGAADTTVAAIYAFFLAMTLYPDVAKKAQAEIDDVVGRDRLPTFADRDSLRYVNALVLEVWRWNTVVPTAVPHRAAQDDIYEGMFIPKGSLVIPNIWKMMHDPRTYRNPMSFVPERYLPSVGKQCEPDPRNVCFGFGRR